MSNVNNPRGLWPVAHSSGGEIRSRPYILTTGQTVFQGDLLVGVDAGTVQAAAAGAGTIVVGVAAEYASDAGSAGGVVVQVYDDPNIIFGIQANGVVNATSMFATANHVAGAGNTLTKLSGHELNAANLGTGAQLKVVGKVDSPDNVWGNFVDLLVLINQHLYKAAVAGIGS